MALEDVGSYTHIASNTGALVVPAPGVPGQSGILLALVINNPGTSWVLTLADGSGGPTIAIVTAVAGMVLVYKARTKNGVFYSGAGTAGDATVTYL